MLSFVHLSDIHFHKNSGDAYDLDDDLRNELRIDIETNFGKHIPHADGILVCGDIAFSGQKNEYDTASIFLKELCDILALDESRVFCVPGNHDVDRTVTRSHSVRLLQRELASASPSETEDLWGRVFRDPRDAETVYASIGSYNDLFAIKFRCSHLPGEAVWSQEMNLDADYKLCIVGINSTIISNEDDHRKDGTEQPMRISFSQIPQRRHKTIYLSLCHHPPDCWIDPEHKLRDKMDARVAVQLYGHKHLQTIKATDRRIVVGSGATHPSRKESEWIPRYNWITLEMERQPDGDFLNVKIYPRVLNSEGTAFEPDKTLKKALAHSYRLRVDAPKEPEPTPGSTLEEEPMMQDVQSVPVDSWEREFVYQFASLPFPAKQRVVAQCGLSSPGDADRKLAVLLNCYIDRIKNRNCVQQVLAAIHTEIERL